MKRCNSIEEKIKVTRKFNKDSTMSLKHKSIFNTRVESVFGGKVVDQIGNKDRYSRPQSAVSSTRSAAIEKQSKIEKYKIMAKIMRNEVEVSMYF